MTLFPLCRILLATVLICSAATACCAQDPGAGTEQDRAAITETDNAIHQAFARGDVEAVMAYHHPEVVKSLSPDRVLRGREAVKADLVETMRTARLEFKQNHVESTVVQRPRDGGLCSLGGESHWMGVDPGAYSAGALIPTP